MLICSLSSDREMTVNTSWVLAEHNVAFATRAANNFLMMEKGRFVASGSIAKLTQDVIHRHLAV